MTDAMEKVQYTVVIKNAPGELHRLTEALARADINILGVSAGALGDVSCVRFIVEKNQDVGRALGGLGVSVFESPAYCVLLPNRPGELARLTKALAAAGVNIETLYGAGVEENGLSRVILAIDFAEKARRSLASLVHPTPTGR
jgi:hypothetical protein